MNFLNTLRLALVVAVACLALSSPILAKSKPTPEMVATAREAIQNFQIVKILEISIRKGLLQVKGIKSLSPKEQAKFFKIVDVETQKAVPAILNRLARREAEQFSQSELNDIREIAAIPYMQHVVLSAVSKKPTPSESELTSEQTELINRLGQTPYVTKFQDNILSKNDLADKEMKSVITIAFKKYFK
jgi:hypothetical protein